MKPFNLEAAKRGDPCMRRDGEPVKFIAHVPEATEGQKVIFLSSEGCVLVRSEKGRYLYTKEMEHPADVGMAPKKKTVWVNIYRLNEAHWFSSIEAADDSAQFHGNTRVGNQAWPLEIEE